MDERLTAFMTDAIEAAGFPAKAMPSGAGHDAMVMAGACPLPCSFCAAPAASVIIPTKLSRDEDVEAALRVGERFLRRLAADVR